mmetsp:Transcript_44317/g.108313  ORF Transcript_44317/g.108313 Transcript_44317/m.108313 type:complete len:264 (-) Transcript_44317:366-1157(-)
MSLGTEVRTTPLPPSEEMTIRGVVGHCLLRPCTTLLSTLPSVPMSSSSTTPLVPSLTKASTLALPVSIASLTNWLSRAFFSAMYFLTKASRRTLSPALRPLEISAASTSLRSSVSTPSSSAAGSFSVATKRVSSFSASLIVLRAASPVKAVILRTPLATASSCTSVNALASSVLPTCVPPHSSRLAPAHASLSGALTISATLLPMLSTRTGSGYFSPNTARSPLMLIAVSRGMTSASTGSFWAICSRQMSSTLTSCSWLRAPL